MKQSERAAIHASRSWSARAWRRSSVLQLAALSLVPLLTGCGDRAPSTAHWRIVERLSEPPDAELFSLVDVTREHVVRAWRLAEPDQAGRWQVEPVAARASVDRRGLWLRAGDPASQQPTLTTTVELDATQISVIELRLRNPSRPSSELLWAENRQRFSAERRIVLERSERDRDQGPIRVLRFDVGEHPEWRGTIHRLRIRPGIGSRRQFAVVSLRAIRIRPDDELLSAATSRAWKIDIQRTIREARVSFRDRPWTARIAVPDDPAELRFVPGLPPDRSGELVLNVRAVEENGGESQLFSTTFSSRTARQGGWQSPVRLPLDGLDNRDLDLVFSATAEGTRDAFVAWGNVQVAARSPERAPPNVVLICLDTLRADHLSAYGYDRETSPRIDRWAAERAVLFEQVVAPAPWTLPSLISIFTGLDTIRHSANYHLPARFGDARRDAGSPGL